jgi:predicted nucleotidyltransferase
MSTRYANLSLTSITGELDPKTRLSFPFPPRARFKQALSLAQRQRRLRIPVPMLNTISDHLSEIKRLCIQYGVARLDLFGSAAHGDFDLQRSDFDFFVRFLDLGWQGSFKRYMGLKLGLEDLLGREVDLVEIDAVTNPHFRRTAEQHRQALYAA